MSNRKHPRPGKCFVKLGAWNAVVFEKFQECITHLLNSCVSVVLGEIDVRQPHMSFVIELRRRDDAALERQSKAAIFLGGFVR